MKTRICGLDPSLNCAGWGVIDYDDSNNTYKLIDYGFIDCKHFDSDEQEDEKLAFIYKTIDAVFKQYKPDVVISESPFYSKNVDTLMKLSHVHGTLLLISNLYSKKMKYYAPQTIKTTVLKGLKVKDENGNKKDGNAMKKEVEKAILEIFPRRQFIKDYTLDVTDALAVAVTWAMKNGEGTVMSKKQRAKLEKEKETKPKKTRKKETEK